MVSKKLVVALVVALAVIGVIAFYLSESGLRTPPGETAYSELTVSNAPKLGENAELIFRVRLLESYPRENKQATILICLPEGITWVENSFVTIDNEIKALRIVPSSEFFIENYANFAVENIWITKSLLEIRGTIRAVENGEWNISAFATGLFPPYTSGFGAKTLGLFVSENEAYVQEGGFRFDSGPSFDNIKPSNVYVNLPSSHIKITLSASLAFDNFVQLTAGVSTSKSLDVEAHINLPENVRLVRGNPSWNGYIDAGSSVDFLVEVDWPQDNQYYKIEADAIGTDSTRTYGDTTTLWIRRFENTLYVEQTRPIENLIKSFRLFPPPESEVSSTHFSPVQVRGSYYFYQNRYDSSLIHLPSDQRFITGWKPLAYAKAELYRLDTLPFQLLRITETDSNGNFVFDPVDIDPWPAGGLPIRVMINPDSDVVRVDRAFPYSGSYHYYFDAIIEHPDEGNIGGFGPSEYHEPLRIFTYINEAWRFLRPWYTMPKVLVAWPEPESIGPFPRGTRYDDGTIFVEDKHDEFPDAVIHEYGHFVMDKVQGGTPPDVLREHHMDTSSNETTAWAEGWAHFFMLAVKNNPYWATTPIDWWDLETDPRKNFELDDTVEGNVAGALWDLFDEVDDNYTHWIWGDLPNYDTISLGFGSIWDVFRSGRFDTFYQFWNAFKSAYSTDAYRVHFSKAALFQNTIDYNLNNPTITITPITGQVTGPPIVSAIPDDPEQEDRPYLWVEFEYSLDHQTWTPFGKDFVLPYQHGLGLDGSYDAVWVRARAWDGMENSSWSETGPFSVVPTEAVLPAITVAPGKQSSPAVAFGDDVIFVVWNDRDAFIRGKIYDLEGNVVRPEFTIAASPKVGAPSIATDGYYFFVAWLDARGESWTSGENWHIRSAFCDPSGEVINSSTIAITNAQPVVAFGSDVFMVAWVDGGKVRAATFDTGGEPISRDLLIYESGLLGLSVRDIYPLQGGRFSIGWTGYTAEMGGDVGYDPDWQSSWRWYYYSYGISVVGESGNLINNKIFDLGVSGRSEHSDGITHSSGASLSYWISHAAVDDRILAAISTDQTYWGSEYDGPTTGWRETWIQTQISIYGDDFNYVSSWTRSDLSGPLEAISDEDMFLTVLSSGKSESYDSCSDTWTEIDLGISLGNLKGAGSAGKFFMVGEQGDDIYAAVVPTLPKLVSPANKGVLSTSAPVFKWRSVDIYGENYPCELVIDNDPDFSTPVLVKSGLISSEYQLSPSEALPDGTYPWHVDYYWRVKSWLWSDVYRFTLETPRQPISMGETRSSRILPNQFQFYELDIPSGTPELTTEIDWLGSDLDLHLYDPQGKHVGYNYETGEVEVEIQGAEYSGRTAKPEWIRVPNPQAGNWTIKVYSYEVDENELYTLRTDVTPPVSSVDAIGPYWRNENPPITVTASDDISIVGVELWYRYSSDNSNWGDWKLYDTDNYGPYSMPFDPPQDDGYYEFYSIATDRGGNRENAPDEADARVGVDTTPPTSHVNPIEPRWNNKTQFAVMATVNDLLSGIGNVELWYRYSSDNLSWSNWQLYGADNEEPYFWRFDASEGEGYYEFCSIATDITGNSEWLNSTFIAPLTYGGLGGFDEYLVSVELWFESDELILAGIEENGDWGWISTMLYLNHIRGMEGEWQIAVAELWLVGEWVRGEIVPSGLPITLPDGTQVIDVSGWIRGHYDFEEGQSGELEGEAKIRCFPKAQASAGVDTTLPTSFINAILPHLQTSLELTAVANDDINVAGVELRYRYSTDNSGWTAWTSFGADTAAPWFWSFTAPNGDGYYEFYSIAVDQAGNREEAPESADARATLDVTPPISSVETILPYWHNAEATPLTVTATASDSFSGVHDVTLWYRYSSENAVWGNWMMLGIDNEVPWQWQFAAPNGDGYYEFCSVATDKVGNAEFIEPVFADEFVSTSLNAVTWSTGKVKVKYDNITVSDGHLYLTSRATTTGTYGAIYAVSNSSFDFSRGLIFDIPMSVSTDNAPSDFRNEFYLMPTFTTTANPHDQPNWLRVSASVDREGVRWMLQRRRGGGGVGTLGENEEIFDNVELAEEPHMYSSAPTARTGGTWRVAIDNKNIIVWLNGELVEPTRPHEMDFTSAYLYLCERTKVAPVYTVAFNYLKVHKFAVDVRAGVDTTPPITSHELSGTEGNAGWWLGDVNVALSAADALSGVSQTLYRVDGGAWQTYADPFVVSGDGVHSVDYHSADIAGNEEETKSIEVKIDTLPPITSQGLSGVAGNAGWWVSDVTVTLGVVDDTSLTADVSGVDLTEYRINSGELVVYAAPFVLHGDAIYVVDYYSVDVAGNEELIKSIEIRIDKTPPVSSVNQIEPCWQNASMVPFTATATASDDLSGVASVELWYRYSPDNLIWGRWVPFGAQGEAPYEWHFNATMGDGYYEFFSIAEDAAGNVEVVERGFERIFADEFVGASLDTAAWSTGKVGVTLENIAVSDGKLKITSRAAKSGTYGAIYAVSKSPFDFGSGMIFEVQMSVPTYDAPADFRSEFYILPRFITSENPHSLPDWLRVSASVDRDGVTWMLQRRVGGGGIGTLGEEEIVEFENEELVDALHMYTSGPTRKLDGVWKIEINSENVTVWLDGQLVEPARPHVLNFTSAYLCLANRTKVAPVYTVTFDYLKVKALEPAADASAGVDTQPPKSSVDPIEPYWQTSIPFTVTATALDNLSGVASVELYYRHSLDNSTWGDWTSFGIDNEVPYEWSFNIPAGHGFYEFYSIARDVAGNVEEPPVEADARCATLIPTTIDIDPDTLNLHSQGRWITIYIELPGGLDPANIDVGTVAIEGDIFLEGILSAEPQPTEIGDHDGDGVPDLMVKFDRSVVQELVSVGDNVELTVIGKWGQAPFRGSDTIRVIEPSEGQGHGNRPEVPPGQSGEHPSQGQGNQGQGNQEGQQGDQGQGPPQTPPGQDGQSPGQGQGNQGSDGGDEQGNGQEQGPPQTPPGQGGQLPGQGNQGNQEQGQGQGNSGGNQGGEQNQGNGEQGQGNGNGNQNQRQDNGRNQGKS